MAAFGIRGPRKGGCKTERKSRERLTQLGKKQTETPLQGNTLARPLVVGREASRVRRLSHLSLGDLLQGVQAGALGVEGVHEMHYVGWSLAKMIDVAFVEVGGDRLSFVLW